MRERAEYRLRYPLLGQPVIRLRGADGEFAARVANLSESGALCDVPPGHGLSAGDHVSGCIDLMQQRTFEFAGRCLRVQARAVAIGFDADRRVPITVIFEEQRTVRARFPEWR
jgi:hypothetical protein